MEPFDAKLVNCSQFSAARKANRLDAAKRTDREYEDLIERMEKSLALSDKLPEPTPGTNEYAIDCEVTDSEIQLQAEYKEKCDGQLLPHVLFTRKSAVKGRTVWNLMGRSNPPSIYAFEEQSQNTIQIKMNWHSSTKIYDERKPGNKTLSLLIAKHTYDALVRNTRTSNDCWRIFNFDLISEALDLKTGVILQPTDRVPNGDVALQNRPHVTMETQHTSSIQKLNSFLSDKFGQYFNERLDALNISCICQSTGDNPSKMLDKIVKTFDACRVREESGCWLSPSKYTYRKVGFWKFHGMKSKELFSFDGKLYERFVIRHHPLRCELFEDHSFCCRISHLSYGTQTRNNRDLNLRREVSHLFNLAKNKSACQRMLQFADFMGDVLEEI